MGRCSGWRAPVGETTLISINAGRTEASITAPAPASLSQHQHHCWRAGSGPGKEPWLPPGARQGLAEHGKLSSHLAGEQASLARARMPRSQSWCCTGCPARSILSTALSGTAWTSASKTPCPHMSPKLASRKIRNRPVPTEARGEDAKYYGGKYFFMCMPCPSPIGAPQMCPTQGSYTNPVVQVQDDLTNH